MTSELEIGRYRDGLAQFIQSCHGDLTPITSMRVVKAREKLCKLTRVQFIDLSIDVYDELQRRNLSTLEAPKHLEAQVGYHPKRNQARQKLAALPTSRFKDLVNDVLFEIDNRQGDGTLIKKRENNNLKNLRINVNGNDNNDNNQHSIVTPLNDGFNVVNNLGNETPTQLKSTTLVPNKSELTWSSDEDDDSREFNGNNGKLPFSNNNSLLRSPSKKVNVATNEILNEHAGPHVKFPVDGEVDDDTPDLSLIQSQISNLEIENSVLKKRELQLQEQIEDLKALEVDNKGLQEQIDTLTSQTDSFKSEVERYKNLDDLETEHQRLIEKYNEKSEQVENLKKILDDNEVNKSIVAEEFGDGEELEIGENDREIIALKAYLEKVLEENEKLKNLQADVDQLNEKNTQLSRDMKIQQRQSLENDSTKWQKKYEDLKTGQIEEYFNSIDGTLNSKLFDTNGLIDISNLASIYSKLNSLLVYLKIGNFEQMRLFDLVSDFVKVVNVLTKDIKLISGSNVIKFDEKKLLLTNSISNLLETTRHYSLFYQILPKIVMNISLTDVYLIVCDIAGLVKIKSSSQLTKDINLTDFNDQQQTTPIDENHNAISQTPMALRINTTDYKNTSMNSLNSPTENLKMDLTSSVRPLKISQRLNESKNNLLLVGDPDSSFDKSFSSTHDLLQSTSVSQPPNMNKKVSNSPIPLQMSIIQPGLDTSPVKNSTGEFDQSFNKINRRDSLIDRMKKLNSSIEDQSIKKTSPVLGNKSISSIKDKFEQFDQNPQSDVAIGGVASGVAAATVAGVAAIPKTVNIKDLSDRLNKTISPRQNGVSLSAIQPDDDDDDDDVDGIHEKLEINNIDDITKKFKSVDEVKFDNQWEGDFDKVKSNGQGQREDNVDEVKSSGQREDNVDEIKLDESINDESGELKLNGKKSIDLNKNFKEIQKPINLNDTPKVVTNILKLDQGDQTFLSNKQLKDVNPTIKEKNENYDEIEEPINFNDTPNIEQSINFNDTPKVISNNIISKLDQDDQTFLPNKSLNDVNSKVNEKKEDFNIAKGNLNETIESSIEKEPISEILNIETPIKTQQIPIKLNDQLNKEIIGKLDNEEDDKKEQFEQVESPISINGNLNGKSNIESIKEDENPFIEKKLDLPIALKKIQGASPIESEFDSSLLINENKSALELDEKLAKRVSRRLSRHISLKNGRLTSDSLTPQLNPDENFTQHKVEGGEVEDEDEDDVDEDDEDEDEDFDIENFNTLNPDNTLRELLLYLEHQTVEVIKAIQTTLGSIKNPKATKGLLREGANEINSVVKAMAEGTSTLMNQSRYTESMGHARYVVDVLEDCVKRMEGIYGDDLSKDSEYAGKNFKQRSAGIAFDVARSTKELVKTVEEASLIDEIAVLDSRLNNTRS